MSILGVTKGDTGSLDYTKLMEPSYVPSCSLDTPGEPPRAHPHTLFKGLYIKDRAPKRFPRHSPIVARICANVVPRVP